VMEALSKLFAISIRWGFLSRFLVGSGSNGVFNISHMLFADDTLVFWGANPDHLHFLRVLFLSFAAVSSLKINLAKSVLIIAITYPKKKKVLIPVGDVDNMDELADIMGCGVSSLPLKYLGLLLGVPFKAKSIWDDVVGKIERRLAS